MTGAALRCSGLVHVYRVAGTDVAALRGIDLEIRPGQSLALLGPSGSGKSTLLQIVAGVLRPSAGHVEVFGRDLASASRREVERIRAEHLGVLLQGAASNLVLHESAAQNVELVARTAADQSAARAVLAAEGLADDDRPTSALTPSEQQVASLAVAMVGSPPLLVADEPTSRLDRDGRDRLLDLLLETVRATGAALMVVTHDEAVARRMDRTIHLRDGRVGEEVTARGRYAVLGTDDSIQLPKEALGEGWTPGALIEARRVPGGVLLRLAEDPDDD
jgi:putative ABC transport system ATP-binding protein